MNRDIFRTHKCATVMANRDSQMSINLFVCYVNEIYGNFSLPECQPGAEALSQVI